MLCGCSQHQMQQNAYTPRYQYRAGYTAYVLRNGRAVAPQKAPARIKRVIAAGNKIINKGRMNAESMYNTENSSAAVNWRWRVEGDETIMPRALYNYGYNFLGSDRYVENGGFLRWNYSQFSYSLNPQWIKNLGVQNVSLSCNFNNILVFTKYTGLDPEISANGWGQAFDNSKTPRSRSFTLSLTVGF